MLVSTVKDTEKEIRKMTKKYFAVTEFDGQIRWTTLHTCDII